MKSGIKKFSIVTLIATLPLWIILAAYIWLDPFKVIRPPYPFIDSSKPMYVGFNKGFESVEAYNHNYKNQKYDSFIFGSSLSIGYRADTWKKYLPAGASIFHFDASSETFDGVLMKMKYIVSKGEKIRNALIVIDPYMMNRENNEYSHLYIQHPDITPMPDLLQFHWAFFKVFLNQDFLFAYIDLKMNRFKPYMKEHSVFSEQILHFNGITNEESNVGYDSLLRTNSDEYYKMRALEFHRKSDKVHVLPTYFNDEIIAKLQQMKEILHSQNTSFKIILPPMYDLSSLSESDKGKLITIFGYDNICDYSGVNIISLDYHNFYDGRSHPRPSTCDSILKTAYFMP